VTALGPPVTVDGPSASIQALNGVSVARDGTGGLVYLKQVNGVSHVFVSRLTGGSFQPPQQLDPGLPGASSQPVIGAGKGGLLVVGFVNGGQLYATRAAGPSSAFSSPSVLFAGAGNPSLSMSSTEPKAYLAFTAVGAGGDDVRCAYFDAGHWSVESTPLDAVATDAAGTGTGRPDVATAGDGVGIVAWGEAGHIFVRRIRGTAPSTAIEPADVPSVSGWNEVAAGDPSVAVGGDSSYVQVIFEESVGNGASEQSRVLMRRLHGSAFEPVAAPDGLDTPGIDDADDPGVSMAEYGNGVATAERTGAHQVDATLLGKSGVAASISQLDSLPNASAPDPVALAAGYYSDLVAWQHDPGALGPAEIRARYYDGSSWGPEMVLSSPALGRTEAADGLFAGSDIQAEVAIAWVQGSGAATSIIAEQLYHSVGGFKAQAAFQYARTTAPVLGWTTPRELWAPAYSVSVDGTVVGQAHATSLRAPTLAQGPHTWSVTAVNGAGLESSTKAATVFVDTVAPTVSMTLSGTNRTNQLVHLRAAYSDLPPGGTAGQSSGIGSAEVNWGDGSATVTIKRSAVHAYSRAGRYTAKLTVTDKAGNRTTATKTILIRKPVARKKPKRAGR
jgi:hypothetical protein